MPEPAERHRGLPLRSVLGGVVLLHALGGDGAGRDADGADAVAAPLEGEAGGEIL